MASCFRPWLCWVRKGLWPDGSSVDAAGHGILFDVESVLGWGVAVTAQAVAGAFGRCGRIECSGSPGEIPSVHPRIRSKASFSKSSLSRFTLRSAGGKLGLEFMMR